MERSGLAAAPTRAQRRAHAKADRRAQADAEADGGDMADIDTETTSAIQAALERHPTRASRRTATTPAAAANGTPDASATSAHEKEKDGVSAPKRKSKSTGGVLARLLRDEESQECQRAAFKAVTEEEDPYELQRILRPTVAERYAKEMWLKLTPEQLTECASAFDFMALGSSVFGKEDRGATTLLHVAAEVKSIPCMRVLLRNGCDIHARDIDGSTPLDEFACNRYLDGIDFLLYEGADPNCKNFSRGTVLHTACSEATKAVVARFVETNMPLDEQDKDGFTPLAWTLDNFDKKEGIASAHYLVQMGADVTIKDNKGTSLLTWAMSKVLQQFDERFCDARDHFKPEAEIAQCFADSADRLQMLEYVLTLEDIDLSAQGSWMRGDVEVAGTIEDLAKQYLEDEVTEREKILREGRAAWRAACKAAASKEETAKRRAEQKGKPKGWAYVPTAAADEGAPMDTSTDAAPTDAAATAASAVGSHSSDVSVVGDKRPAAPAVATDEAESTRKRARRHTASATPAATAAEKDDDREEAGSLADGDSDRVVECGFEMNNGPRPGTSVVHGRTFITGAAHFRTALKVHEGRCETCNELYPNETIPEACWRLLFMEQLRRACNAGDWGDAERVRQLLEMRQQYPCLAKLRYHQHSALPPRSGPLHIASSYEDEGSNGLKILQLLLRAGVEDFTCNAEGLNSLQLVCEVGDVSAAEQFIRAGFDPNSIGTQPDEYTPLMLCCDSLDHGEAIAERLLNAGAQLATRDKFQNTAFHWAVYKGNAGVLEVLMRHAKKLGLTGSAAVAGDRATSSSAARSAAKRKARDFSDIVIESVVAASPTVIRLKRAPTPAAGPADATSAAPSATAPPAAASASSDAAAAAASSASSSSSSPSSAINPFFLSTNHWGNTIMHYACYKGFKTEGHFECLRALLRAGIPYDQPKNLSGLVPRQVVAGFNAKHLRGQRVLVLLNSGGKKLLVEPRGREIEEVKVKVSRLESVIHRILRRLVPGQPEMELSQPDRTELNKLRKEYRPAEELMLKLVEESRCELERRLDQLDQTNPNLRKLDWTPENGATAVVPPVVPYTESDISRGREWTPIRLENDIDCSGGINYRYITHCLPHPDLQFPLPLASGAADVPTAIAQPKLNAQQLVEAQKFEAKRKTLQTQADQKRANMKRKVGKANASKTPSSAPRATSSSSSSSPSPSSVHLVKKASSSSSEVEPNPRCHCTGPNACQDASCPCFRRHTDKVLRDRDDGGKVQSTSDAVARMGRLATKIEQLCNCHELCGCRLDCSNRHIARGIRVRLAVVKTAHKGWACMADELIPRGTFICEYVGEIVPPSVAEERLFRYDKEGIHYVFGFQDSDVCIDPVNVGNVARTINHSCAPNLTKIQIYGSCMRSGKRFPKMAFFAAREIPKGEELAISYDYEEQEHPGGCLVCYCDTDQCRHTLV